MSGKKGSFRYFVIVFIFILILSACERPLQSDKDTESEAVATEVVVTAVAETDAVIEQEEAVEEAASTAVADVEAEVEATEAVEVETETESTAEQAEADEESPRPAEVETDPDVTTPEVEESPATDPNAGGGTPDTVEEAPDTVEEAPATEAGETEVVEEVVEEPAAEAEESMSDTTASEGETAGETAETEESASGEAVTETQTTPDEAAVQAQSTLPTTHTVQPGENLYRIGLQYGLSWVSLARYNNIYNPNHIYAGQVLQIPGVNTTPPTAPDPVPPVENPPNYVNYTVKPGDTLGKIGQAFGVRPEVIAEVNGIVNPNKIYAGQVLKIPTSTPESPPATTHVVQSGETLNRISLQYGVHWRSIARANNIWPPYVIYPGQTLVIPGG